MLTRRFVKTFIFCVSFLVAAFVFYMYKVPIDAWILITVSSLAGLIMIVCVCGVLGISFSNLRQKSLNAARSDVVIRKSSWHYKFIKWINLNLEEEKVSEVLSECEYWALFFHSLFMMPFVWAICILLALLLWLMGSRISITKKGVVFFGSQPIGPAVLILISLAMITVAIVVSGFAEVIISGAKERAAHLTIEDFYTFISWAVVLFMALIAVLIAGFFIWKVALPDLRLVWSEVRTAGGSVKHLFLYLMARLAVGCRGVKFTE